MAETLNVPGDGTVSKRFMLVGGALVAGILGWAYLHRSQTVAGPDVGQEQTGTELPPADLGTVSTGGGASTTGLQFITTNDQWAQDATAKLVDLGFDAIMVSTALGKYLNAQVVTRQEAEYIYTAIALAGKPPVGEHSVMLAPESPPTTPPPSGGGTKPPSSGKPARVTGLHVHRTTSRYIYLSWDHTSGALGYALYRDGKARTFPPSNYATVGHVHGTYTVKAWNRHGYGEASAPLVV